MTIQGAHFAAVITTGSANATGMRVGSIVAFIDVAVGVLPETGDAWKIATEGRGRIVNQVAWIKVVAPRIAIYS